MKTEIEIHYKQVQSKEEAYKKASKLISPEYLKKWNQKINLTCQEKDCIINAEGKGFSLTLTFKESKACVAIVLPLSLSLFKNIILTKVQEEFSKHL